MVDLLQQELKFAYLRCCKALRRVWPFGFDAIMLLNVEDWIIL